MSPLEDDVQQRAALQAQCSRTGAQRPQVKEPEHLANSSGYFKFTAIWLGGATTENRLRFKLIFFDVVPCDCFDTKTLAGLGIINQLDLSLSEYALLWPLPMLKSVEALGREFVGKVGKNDFYFDWDRYWRINRFVYVIRVIKIEFLYRRKSFQPV
jgi:hypothetical protein